MTEHVVAVFPVPKAAQAAVAGLIEDEVDSNEITVSVEHPSGQYLLAVQHVTGWVRGSLVGSGAGALLGVGLAALVNAGVLGSPALSFLADGVLLGLVRGLVLGGVVGLLLGATAGFGSWRDELEIPPEELNPGKVTIAVNADGARAQHIRERLQRSGAESVSSAPNLP